MNILMPGNKKAYIVALVIFFVLGAGFAVGAPNLFSQSDDNPDDVFVSQKGINPLAREHSEDYKNKVREFQNKIEEECLKDEASGENSLSCTNSRLRIIAKSYGARLTLDVIEPLYPKYIETLGGNHDLAHTAGEYALLHDYSKEPGVPGRASDLSTPEKIVNKIGRTLVECDGWGAFGCYHGTIERGLSHLAPEERTSVIKKACMENELIQETQFYRNQCLHWFGHGMAIFTDQSLNETLRQCASLTKDFGSDEVQLCLSGVFHSGAAPGTSDTDFAHNIDRVRDEDDPYYPCRQIPKKFKTHCYSHAPGRLQADSVPPLFEVCNGIPEGSGLEKAMYIRGCYVSASNSLLVNSHFKPDEVIKNCNEVSKDPYAKYCYGGAARYAILRDPLLNNMTPFEICERVPEDAKETCYAYIGFGLNENYYSEEVLEKQCSKGEDEYVDACMSKSPPVPDLDEIN